MDYNDETLKGSWCPEKIQEISDKQYCIEKVLRKRTLPNGTKDYLSRGKVGQTSTTRKYKKLTSTMSSMSDKF